MQTDASVLAALLRRIAGGDRVAFSQLYDATAPKLLGVLLRILRQRAVAEDVLQDVYVKVWHHAERFDPGKAAAMTWLTAIARHGALDEIRRRRPEVRDDATEAMALVDPQPLALDHLISKQEADVLKRCLDTLEPQRRDLVRLAYLEGLSREELGRRFGHPTATIKTWLHRSLKQLKGCLEP